MSEATTTTEPSVVTKEEAMQLAQAAAQAAVAEFKDKNPSLTQDQVRAQILEDRKTLASQILGQTPSSQSDPVRELLEKDPSAALALFGDALREDISSRVLGEIKGDLDKKEEQRIAVAVVLNERPDISSSESQLNLLNTFYKGTDSALPEKERVKEALRQVDLLLEQQGLGDKESRVKKFSSVKSSSAGAQGPSKTVTDPDEVYREILSERQSRHAALRRQ
jgi:hypothetical protein